MRGFIIKEFYHIFRDVRTMIILFGMPVIQILLFGFALTNEIRNARIAVLDHSKDDVTTEIISRITSSGYFILDEYLESEEQIEDLFRKGKIKEVIIFEENFAEKLVKDKTAGIQIIGDASDPNTANLLANYTNAIIKDYQAGMLLNQASIPMVITPEPKMLFNPELKGVFMFVPGIITILLMLVCAMMTSISIAKEKELGTMEILLVSPLKPLQIILGKVTPYILLSLINALTILALGYFVFGMPMRGNIVLLLLETILFIIMALSMGILISTIAKTQQVALMVSLAGLMLPTILLSGFIFPVENMPWALRTLSNIMPSKWFIIIIKNIMLKGIDITYIWKETLILVFMTLFFITLSVKNFKIRLA
ncbi:MAG TPA: ABC transporter permease [Bacteroidales bacterium]|nr:ABC transporter permease [Bacteroidales bacterium]HOX78742.1 ABC transporter permease [Bacteroidales bacterium]